MQDALLQCRAELERLKKEQEEFLYLVSHDLKAPVRAIVNLAGWVEEDLAGTVPEETGKNLALLQARALRLESMINAILELSRVYNRDLTLATINLSELLHNTAADFMPEQHVFDIPAGLPEITTFVTKLRTVVAELFRNAIQYSGQAITHIKISVTETEDFLYFRVQDNGPGLPPEMAEKIFSIFYTGRPKDGESAGGIGAGLTLARRITDFVGGTLTLETNSGTGCSFLIKWPRTITVTP